MRLPPSLQQLAQRNYFFSWSPLATVMVVAGYGRLHRLSGRLSRCRNLQENRRTVEPSLKLVQRFFAVMAVVGHESILATRFCDDSCRLCAGDGYEDREYKR